MSTASAAGKGQLAAGKAEPAGQRIRDIAAKAVARAEVAKEQVRAAKKELKKARKAWKREKKSAKLACKKLATLRVDDAPTNGAKSRSAAIPDKDASVGRAKRPRRKPLARSSGSKPRQSAAEVARSVIHRLASAEAPAPGTTSSPPASRAIAGRGPGKAKSKLASPARRGTTPVKAPTTEKIAAPEAIIAIEKNAATPSQADGDAPDASQRAADG